MASACATAQDEALAPFGAEVVDAVARYDRLTPTIAGGAAPEPGGYGILARAGIRTVIDLRTPREGVAEARREALAAGLRYFNLPVGADPPSRQVLEEFAALTANDALEPLYFHCRSGVRAGAVWAIHRRRQGVGADQAILEGRTIGLSGERIAQVRAYSSSLP